MVRKNKEHKKRDFFSQKLDETKSFKLHLCGLPKTWFFNVFFRNLFWRIVNVTYRSGNNLVSCFFCEHLSMEQKMQSQMFWQITLLLELLMRKFL